MELKQHPLSAAFPPMQTAEYQALKDSVTNVGVQNPITLFEGQVLDGWNRYQAALDVGMPCPTIEFADADPVDFVRVQNLTRRNMTAAQIAMAIAAIYQWHPAHREEAHTQCEVKTNFQLAELAGVHPNTISQAKSVQSHAAPEVQAAVKSGEIGLPKAAAIAKMLPAQQVAAIAKPLPKKVAAGKAPPEEDGAPDAAELESVRISEAAELKTLQLLLASDKPLADLAARNTQLEAQIGQLNLRISGLMNSNTEYIRTIKRLQSQIRQQAVAV
jgi:hypothetical protein